MAIQTHVVHLDGTGSNEYETPPCFFAGHDGGTVSDSGIASLSAEYTHGTMPFVRGDFTVTGTPNSDVLLYLDF